MNFFEHQDQAKKNTNKLIALFILAVASLIAITTAVVSAFIYYFTYNNNKGFNHYDLESSNIPLDQILNWELLGIISFFVGSVILAGTLYKTRQLSQGGDFVAASLGGTLVLPDTDNSDERKALNVIAEMAIASGTPIPNLYLLNEDGLNAFAAGTKPQNAAIGLTRGCISSLSRDELQGVVAHEFSHILHGDMLINMRLTGILHGILLIGLIGRSIMRGDRRSYHSRRNSKNNAAILGLALFAVGYIGIFFGKIIKSAVSRQREFLADASAVQFTRNPEGISSALQKIGGHHSHSQLTHPNTEQFSHLFFGNALTSSFFKLFATHPPLAERIRRIKPNWDESFSSSSLNPEPHKNHKDSVSSFSQPPDNPKQAIDTIGEITPENLIHSKLLLATLPEKLTLASQNSFSARAIIYCLLLANNNQSKNNWQELKTRAHPIIFKLTEELFQYTQRLSDKERLPLFELCLPALSQLSPSQEAVFKKNVIHLIKVDNHVSIFEWSMYRLLKNKLENKNISLRATKSFPQLKLACQQLLSFIIHSDDLKTANHLSTYSEALNLLNLNGLELIAKDQLSLPMLDDSLARLNQLSPLKKPQLLKSIIHIIQSNENVSTTEYELFRAIAYCLECPAPPLLQENIQA
jgi:Zn-dependent protease with chaperone function